MKYLFQPERAANGGYSETVFALLIYKIASLFTGAFFAYLGFRLFMVGVIEKAGELEQTYGKEHLVLRAAAPGTFFSLFGCAIVVVTLVRGLKTPKIEMKETPEGHTTYFSAGGGAAAPPVGP